MELLQDIKTMAKSKGMTLEEVCRKAGIHERSIYRWDKTMPSADKLAKVADVLETSSEALLRIK